MTTRRDKVIAITLYIDEGSHAQLMRVREVLDLGSVSLASVAYTLMQEGLRVFDKNQKDGDE